MRASRRVFPASAGLSWRLRNDIRVLKLIDDRAVLDRAPPEPGFKDVACFFEDPARRRIVRKRQPEQTRQPVLVDRVAGDRGERLGCDATTPERLAEPVADL